MFLLSDWDIKCVKNVNHLLVHFVLSAIQPLFSQSLPHGLPHLPNNNNNNNDNNNILIYKAPFGRNFRGTVGKAV